VVVGPHPRFFLPSNNRRLSPCPCTTISSVRSLGVAIVPDTPRLLVTRATVKAVGAQKALKKPWALKRGTGAQANRRTGEESGTRAGAAFLR